MDRGHVGSGTVAVAVGLLVECNPAVKSSILASEHLHVVRHHRGRYNGARGHAGRDQHRARARSETQALPPGCSPTFTAPASSLIGSQLCGPRWCCGCSQVLCASTAGWSWSGMASKPPSAAGKCQPSSFCISNRNPTPSPNTSWGIPCRLSACSYTRLRASSLYRSRRVSTKAWFGRDRRTLLDKMLGLLDILALRAPFYFVADAYYAAGKMVSGLLKQGNHLVTRVKSNAVAYAPAPRKKGRRTRGRPKTYGEKIKLKSLLANPKSMQQVASPVYGERNVTLRYRVCDLLWRPAGRLVRFVVVVHPTRGACILMCTDTSLSAIDIVRLYGLRFKIEHSFKQATRQIGSFAYHFWMKDMVLLRYHNCNQYLHRKSADYRSRVKRKMCAYLAFIQAAVVAQGPRPSIPPSEFVVANALRQSLPDFLLGPAKSDSLTN